MTLPMLAYTNVCRKKRAAVIERELRQTEGRVSCNRIKDGQSNDDDRVVARFPA